MHTSDVPAPCPPADLSSLRPGLTEADAQPSSLLERAIFSQIASASAHPPPPPPPVKFDISSSKLEEDEEEEENEEEGRQARDNSLPVLSSCQVRLSEIEKRSS